MSLRLFEALSVATVLLTLVVMARSRSPKTLVVEYVSLAVAGWLGEESMIAAYHFYSYSPGWDLRLVDVPVLVPLIWPLVVLSAKDVVGALTARRHVSRVVRAGLVGAFVVFDASLVEVVAVRAGLWSWAEPGYLGVPLIGILGWGFFAAFAVFPMLNAAADPPLAPTPSRVLATIVSGPLGAHLLVEAAWWGVFRHTLRGDLGFTPGRILAAGLVPLLLALVARRRGLALPLSIAAPRIVAALLFFALLVWNAGAETALLAHALAVAVPYTLLTRPWSFAMPQHPGREFC